MYVPSSPFTALSSNTLLLRIILTSTKPGDTFFDGMAGVGTSAVVAYQLKRNSISIELSPFYVEWIRKRIESIKDSDDIMQYYNYYRYTPNIEEIWLQDKIKNILNY